MRTFSSKDLMSLYENKGKFAFVLSTKGGKSFLYKIEQADSPTLHFVNVAVGKKWLYIGVLSYGQFKLTPASNFRFYEPECAVFGKTWDKVMAELPIPDMVIAHAPVKCKECNNWLIRFESVKRGIGAQCARKALVRENKRLKEELDILYEMGFVNE